MKIKIISIFVCILFVTPLVAIGKEIVEENTAQSHLQNMASDKEDNYHLSPFTFNADSKGVLYNFNLITREIIKIDEFGSKPNQITDSAITNNLNNPPTAPNITGPIRGKVGVEYEWTFLSTDPEGDNITYYIDWGEGCGGAEWHGPYPSGEKQVIANTYYSENTFIINSMAVDEHGAESNWTYFEVTIPKNKGCKNFYFSNQLIQKWGEKFFHKKYA